MSFLRPTMSSLRRAVNGGKDEQHLHGGPSATAGVAQPLPAQPIFHNAATGDYSHVSSRVDTGLRSRVRTSSLTRRPAVIAMSRSPSLREFSDKCDSVIQRAQEMLERTREQELKVTKALEERKSQSPARQATPPPQREMTPQRTPANMPAGLASPSSSPATLNAPYTTPVIPPRASSTLTTTSPSLPLLPAPPPTPAGLPHSPPPTQPATDKSPSDPVGRFSPPSLFQRLRQSWQRGSGLAWEAHATSPTPSSPDGALSVGIARMSPRKSVRFASPDKLETVTPTKVVALSSDDDDDDEDEEDEETSEDEEEEEQEQLPPTKKTRAESSGCRHTPHRDSVVVPPAPPPSAVKSGSRSRSGSSTSLPSSRSPPPSRGTASPPSSHREGTRSPSSTHTTSPRQCSGISGDGSRSGRSSTSSSRPPMDHDEVKEYVIHHTIRRSLSRISRANMEDYLREEGVALPAEGHWLKRQLLAHIRALIKQELAPH
ncbi:conserved hypothetical protein [Leishmania infantum JPCM5]|uniref:Uncharacterized protein n=2 Tax=Leishmania infantum TaxID=5671 RepID=A4I578_LEIIN|nr:conserved hypothetical protein [Leishmania infantum JPCM5]CAC9512047.1 hypothetical_protein_-_conserved [Leishmania infantum]CAM69946.1 conserved hypothetical protein [Leishmania infantum JPCM5]SUZ43865.1 hypothetical_protein_-_conserved [Leishmania infantum]|eukprot:XP_001466897.1 conserved hypothetical protein [Leishmania infantum JPCM5]